MLEMLWQLGILSAILVFGVKIGMAMGFAGLSKKQVAIITLINGICIIVLSKLCEPYMDTLYRVIYQYSSLIFGLMAVIILLTGLHTIREWKITKKTCANVTSLALIVPCPCCIGAVVGSVIVVAPMVSVSTLFLGSFSSVFLMITIVVFYLLSGWIVKKINKPYPLVLGTFMTFVGIYFLVAMTILPNISKALAGNYDSISIGIPYNFLIIGVVMAFVVLVSAYFKLKFENIN